MALAHDERPKTEIGDRKWEIGNEVGQEGKTGWKRGRRLVTEIGGTDVSLEFYGRGPGRQGVRAPGSGFPRP